LPWDGGLDEMAKHYLDLIAAELSGPIMLGGEPSPQGPQGHSITCWSGRWS
jgi:hypothetical protein